MKHYLPLTAAAGLLVLAGCAGPNDEAPPPPPPTVVYAEPPPPSAGPSDNGVNGPSETTYVPPGTYASAPSYPQDDYDGPSGPVPEEGEVQVQTVDDFDEPLAPYGDWVVVPNYGRCWRPRRVASDWRPYCEGTWVDTDRGWYWRSEEPWGWATYHYGRWDYQPGFGWVWVPHTRWAPAWVEWRTGGGYVGWAPLPPSARFNHGHDIHAGPVPDRNFVFIENHHFGDRVRPSTVIVNNTTIIHQTTTITNITVINNQVHTGGPRPETLQKETGRQFHPVQAVQLRREIEKPVAVQHPVLSHPHTNPNPRTGTNAPATPNQQARPNGPHEPLGNPAQNSQPTGAAPERRVNDRVENHDANTTRRPNDLAPTAGESGNPQHNVAPRPTTPPRPSPLPQPTSLPHPTTLPRPTSLPNANVHPTQPPERVNPELRHDLNARPTLAPLHQDTQHAPLNATPTMHPLENHGNTTIVHPVAHPVAPTHVPAPVTHVEAAPVRASANPPVQVAPQQRQRVPQESTVVVPHSNESYSNGGRSNTPQNGAASENAHAPEHHDAAPAHQAPAPVVHTKPAPPPPPPPKSQDNSKDQPTPNK